MKFASRLVSFDVAPGDPFRPMATPIYQTATYAQDEATAFGPYDYSRSGNPTRTVLEEQIAALENGTRGFCFASGMAAITCITRLLRTGDEIVADSDLYGGTCRLFTRVLERTGIRARYADACDEEEFAAQITGGTKLVYLESPTNPLLRVVDIRRIAERAHANGALLAVDSSAMSPYLQNPLDLGADIVLHSATKYLCGHSDVTGGVVVVKDDELAQQIYFLQNAEGNALGPFDAFLFLRGLKTLKLRLDCQQKNAQTIAEWLQAQRQVKTVNYPGLETSPSFLLQRRQARGAGAVLSFTTGSVELSQRIVESARLFSICVSFGSINSTISLPGCMSHASVPKEVGELRNLPCDLVRLSVGIEDAGDLIADLEQAFAASAIAPAEVGEPNASEVA
jgi:cysteine-S-conjugate beta-lyase